MSANDGAGRRGPPGCALTAGRITYLLIIAVLAFILVQSFRGVRGPQPITQTEALMLGLSMALDQYKVIYHVYPPDTGTGLHPDLNLSAECLVYYLISGGSMAYGPGEPPPSVLWKHGLFRDPNADGTGRNKLPYFHLFNDRMRADTDGDGIPEVTDPWGTPLLYNTDGGLNGPFNANGAPRHNRGKYDLSSAGPDKQHGTADDIKNWGE